MLVGRRVRQWKLICSLHNIRLPGGPKRYGDDFGLIQSDKEGHDTQYFNRTSQASKSITLVSLLFTPSLRNDLYVV